MATFIEKLLCPSVEGQQQELNEVKKRIDDLEQNLVCMWRASEAKLQRQILDRFGALESAHVDTTEALSMLESRLSNEEKLTDSVLSSLRILAGKMEIGLGESLAAAAKSPGLFQSGKSQLASDTLEDEEIVADGIKFEGEKGIEYVTRLIERRGEAKKLLQAQQRMINRLYKLAVTTVEDPGKSITEELRKAEKWKKTLRKKLKAFEEE